MDDECEHKKEAKKIGITIPVPSTLKDFYSNGIRQNCLYLYELLQNTGYDVRLITENKKTEPTNVTTQQQVSNSCECILEQTNILVADASCECIESDSIQTDEPCAFSPVAEPINESVSIPIKEEKPKTALDDIDFYDFKSITIDEMIDFHFDLVISMGFSFPDIYCSQLRQQNVKIVSYVCGNNFLIEAEQILYSQHKNKTISYDMKQKYDEIWMIPQMYKQNKHYTETLTRTKCIQVPFVWSPMSIQIVSKVLQLPDDSSLLYKKKESKIGIFEPNISVMKWALPAVLIAEITHRKYQNVQHVFITNLNNKTESDHINLFNMAQFNNSCRSLDLFNAKKLSSESRFITLDFMSKHCDIAVSHQWENPLNYLYLDLAWMGWPILHNAELCKDVGYYYEEFNYEMGAEMLNDIIQNHEHNAVEYLIKNRKIIDRYIPTNVALQDAYRCLIDGVLTTATL